jgi:hypothetical protein
MVDMACKLLFALLVPALVLAQQAGAGGFEKPLTSFPSKDINTWLLGVWEHKNEQGVTYRATVTPKTGDRFWVDVRQLGKTPAQTTSAQFEAWISRVGSTSFLTMRCLDGGGPVPPGEHAFVQYTLLYQDAVRVRIPQVDAAPGASSFQLRREIRRKLRDQTLFMEPGTDWERVSEVYWATGDEPQPYQPLRYPPEPQPEGQ